MNADCGTCNCVMEDEQIVAIHLAAGHELKRPNVHFSSASVEWPTPKAVYEQLDREFRFDFDPCPIDGSADGLATLLTPWYGRRVFCNPPYGPEIRKWLERAHEAELAVFLIPARTDTKWFHEIVLPKSREIRFIKGRLKFGDAKNSAPFPSMIVVFNFTSSAVGNSESGAGGEP